jgi:hypothetical protein
MVLIKEDNVVPLHWPLGRVVQVHPGHDGVVRVVSVKTAKGVYNEKFEKSDWPTAVRFYIVGTRADD